MAEELRSDNQFQCPEDAPLDGPQVLICSSLAHIEANSEKVWISWLVHLRRISRPNFLKCLSQEVSPTRRRYSNSSKNRTREAERKAFLEFLGFGAVSEPGIRLFYELRFDKTTETDLFCSVLSRYFMRGCVGRHCRDSFEKRVYSKDHR